MKKPDSPVTLLLVGISVVAVLCLALFVWPTIYRYDHTTVGRTSGLLVRTNRLTGRSAVLVGGDWSSDSDAPTPRQLPQEALARIQAAISGWPQLQASVQNGSDWTLQTLIVNVTWDEVHGPAVKDRQVILTRREGTGSPGTNSLFGAEVQLSGHPVLAPAPATVPAPDGTLTLEQAFGLQTPKYEAKVAGATGTR